MEIIVIIGLFIYCFSLSQRLRAIEEKLKKPEQTFSPQIISAEGHQVAAPSFSNIPLPAQPEVSPILEWIKKDFMVKLGAFLLLLAMGWFVSYAFSNNWVGPWGRIFLGFMAGVLCMVLGVWRIPKFLQQGSVFVALGSGVVFLTVYAARFIYDFFEPVSALSIMFLAVFCTAYISVVYRNQNLAIAGLVLGAIAPLLTHAPEPNVMGLFSYVLVLVLGSIWVMGLLEAEILLLTSLGIVGVYSLPFMLDSMSAGDGETALLFGFLFTIVFFVSNTISILRRTDVLPHPAHLFVAAGTGLYVAGWIETGIVSAWQGPMFLVWAAVFTAAAALISARSKREAPLYIYAGVAIGLLAAATAAFFDGAVLAIAYNLEVAALVALCAIYMQNEKVLERMALLFAGPIILSVEHLGAYEWNNGFMHEHCAVLVSLAACFAVVGMLLSSRLEMFKKSIGGVLLGLGAVYGLILVWLVSHSVLASDTATTLSLFVYTGIGLLTYVAGVSGEAKRLKLFGASLIGFVVLRLLIIDVWQMALLGRIITFFVIGVLLISTAFIGKLNKER